MLKSGPKGLAGGLCVGLVSSSACAVVLFDGALGTTPSAQGWPFLANPLFGNTVTQTAGPAFTTLDTLDPRSDQGGYFSENPLFPAQAHPNMPTLDGAAGFTVRVELRIDTELHNPRDDNDDGVFDRAGFSIIVVTEQVQAVELAFWEDEIWAYEDDGVSATDLFTHAEGVLFDTTEAVRRFDIAIQGGVYELRVNGIPILSGPMRDYSSFSGTVDPYEVPSFLFLGDDTGSAESRSEIARIEVISGISPICPGDANGDGVVDINDLNVVLGNFGSTVSPGTNGDLNASGGVDISDLNLVLGNFAVPCP